MDATVEFLHTKEMLIEENGDKKYIQETAEMIVPLSKNHLAKPSQVEMIVADSLALHLMPLCG